MNSQTSDTLYPTTTYVSLPGLDLQLGVSAGKCMRITSVRAQAGSSSPSQSPDTWPVSSVLHLIDTGVQVC
jgi:hypothetical protein